MRNVEIRLTGANRWRTLDGVHVWGDAFWRGGGDGVLPLPETFAPVRSANDFIALVKRLNGFYAVVVEREDVICAAVDHTRSCPLFYGQKEGRVYLSDDAYWVRDQVGDGEFEELAATEYSLCGYVTGADTLHARVKQLQAGEAIIVQSGSEGAVVRCERYYRRIYGNAMDASLEELSSLHEQVVEQSMRRLVTWANGRCLCLPLSSGRDSGLIALMLHRLGYKNIIAFSYGKPGNSDATGSHKVAKRLGFPWHFVPYSLESWHKWFHSPERQACYRMADGLSALPHLQDWPALWELRKAGVLPADAAFVPGHAGTRLRSRLLRPGNRAPLESQLVRLIWTWHYCLTKWDQKGDLGRRLRQRVLDRCESPQLKTFLDMESAAEKWIWQERNAKFIVNSVRDYEYWGYQWWLPLMDLELLEFWSRVPVQYRTDRLGYKLFYEAHVDQMWENFGAGDHKPARVWVGGISWPVRQLLYRARVASLARPIIHRLKRKGEYDRYHLATWGAMPRGVHRKFYTGREDINWFFAMERLGRISFQ